MLTQTTYLTDFLARTATTAHVGFIGRIRVAPEILLAFPEAMAHHSYFPRPCAIRPLSPGGVRGIGGAIGNPGSAKPSCTALTGEVVVLDPSGGADEEFALFPRRGQAC
jgi:hypothetical protein